MPFGMSSPALEIVQLVCLGVHVTVEYGIAIDQNTPRQSWRVTSTGNRFAWRKRAVLAWHCYDMRRLGEEGVKKMPGLPAISPQAHLHADPPSGQHK